MNHLAQTEPKVTDVISTWRHGDSPDACRFLSDHPNLAEHKSNVLELAYEEFCLRCEAGEEIAASTFCDRFPTYRKSLRRLIDVHQFFEHNPTLSASYEDLPWPKPGSVFCDFDIIRELGRGTFARVFLARQPALGNRPVVIKVSPVGDGEAETLGRLSHPNIVPVHSVNDDLDTGFSAVCMPYLGSATLSDLVDLVNDKRPEKAAVILEAVERANQHPDDARYSTGEPVTDPLLQRANYVDGVAHLGEQLAEALFYAHQRGVLHRDLKPSNVLITLQGTPMLLDFNLSSDVEVEVTRVGGTIPYMPPEQLRAVFLDPTDERGDTRSDIFALGVILYELLTGRLPFGEVDPRQAAPEQAQKLLTAQQAEIPRVRTLNQRVDRNLESIIHRCLDPDIEKRHATATDLVEEFKRRNSWWLSAQRWVSRHRWLSTAVVTLLVVGMVALGLRPPTWEREYRRGVQELDLRRAAAAVPHFDRALKALPDERPQSAADQARVRWAYGHALLSVGKAEQALHQFESLNNLIQSGALPADPRVPAWMGFAYLELGQPDKAEACFQAALADGYRTAPVYCNLATALSMKRERTSDWKQIAADHYERALELDPGLVPAVVGWFSLWSGEIARGDEQHLRATRAHLERSIDAGVTDGRVFSFAALVYLQLSRRQPQDKSLATECRESLRKAYQRGIRNAQVPPPLRGLFGKATIEEARQHHLGRGGKVRETKRYWPPGQVIPGDEALGYLVLGK